MARLVAIVEKQNFLRIAVAELIDISNKAKQVTDPQERKQCNVSLHYENTEQLIGKANKEKWYQTKRRKTLIQRGLSTASRPCFFLLDLSKFFK